MMLYDRRGGQQLCSTWKENDGQISRITAIIDPGENQETTHLGGKCVCAGKFVVSYGRCSIESDLFSSLWFFEVAVWCVPIDR
jgi:hypothetical protein